MGTKTSYMRNGGPSVRLTRKDADIEWIVPFTDEFQLTTTQEIKTPIKDFMKDLENFVYNTAATNASGLAPAVKQVQKISENFGVHLANQGYYAASWGGSLPSEFNLSLNFYLGSLHLWDAKTEVFNPIMEIMSYTVPAEHGIVVTPPMPPGIDVFIAYGSLLIEGAKESARSITSGFSSLLKSIGDIDESTLREQETAYNTAPVSDKITMLYNNVWSVDFGWCDRTFENFKSFYTLNNIIVSSSSLKFSPQVQNINGIPFPISGSVSLAMRSEFLVTNKNFASK